MVHHGTTNAVVFEEGKGYFLVKALTHGKKAQSYIVRSLENGQLLARKKLAAQPSSFTPHSDSRVASLVHPTIGPELLDSVEYADGQNALFYKFCNGGDLRELMEKISERVDHREKLDPLIHRDIWAGNFFLDWSNPLAMPSLLPSIHLGDFGSAQYVSEGDKGRGPTSIGNDIYGICYTLLVLVLGKPLAAAGNNVQQDQVRDLIPDVYSDEMKDIAVALSVHVVGTSWAPSWEKIRNWPELDTLELARNVIPLADRMLQRCADEGRISDLSWTKPRISDVPLFFDDEAALNQWCQEKNEGKPLQGKWRLVPIQKDTLRILQRSELDAIPPLPHWCYVSLGLIVFLSCLALIICILKGAPC